MKVKVQLVHSLARFIYYKLLPHNNIIAALMGNYCSRKRLGISLAMCKQKKICLENNISEAKNSSILQILPTMPEIISNRRRCALCSPKNREKNAYNMYVLVCLPSYENFSLCHQNYMR